MATLFFINGANPDNNAIGCIALNYSRYHDEERGIVSGFSIQPIKGFKGLRLIVKGDNPIGQAYLFIMECLYHGELSLKKDFMKLSRFVNSSK